MISRSATPFNLVVVRPLVFCLSFLACIPFVGCQHARQTTDKASLGTGVGPKPVFPEEAFEFGNLPSGAVIEHDFVIRNQGDAAISIQKVSMTTPLLVTQMPGKIPPGAESKIHFKLDTKDLAGKFDGVIAVFLNDPAFEPAHLVFTGRIVPPIELTPMPAFFAAGRKGVGGHESIEIVDHEAEPLRIERIDHPTERYTTRLETIEEGRRYRLTLILKPDGPAGRGTDSIVVHTSSKKMPSFRIDANTYLFERVRAFPDSIALGTLRTTDSADPGQTLMIYQDGGKDFQVKLSTDVPGLRLTWERGSQGDRYQAQVTVAEKISPGAIKGSIFVDTNDPQFPRFTVPVSGNVVEH